MIFRVVTLIGLVFTSTLAMAQETNLIQNGSFEAATGTTLPAGWTSTGSVQSIAPDRSEQSEGNISLRIESAPKQSMHLRQDVAVEPRTEYLFTASIKSNDRIFAYVRDVPMSYHHQGNWQTVVGLIRTGDETSITVSFELTGLSDRAPMARLDDVSLRKFVRPGALKRKFDASTTSLVQGGQAQATIIYPGAIAEYKALAEQVQSAVAAQTGVTLPIATDVDATETKNPILKPEFARQNLIIIGRLGINRALWPAYNRFLDATDGYYPGGDGYVVRTAANVLRNGKNHLILGGSSEAGAARAVQKFVEIINQSPKQSGMLSLGWLLDIDLGGECLTAMQAHDAIWAANPEDPKLFPIEPGYGVIRRWYENAMGYYWTGWDSYKARTLTDLEPILKDRAYAHHYVQEFFVRTYDMLDDSPLFTTEQKEAIESLFVENFADWMTEKGDISWMTVFSPPYENINLLNRHQIAPWMVDLTMATYLTDYFEPAGDISTLAEFRRSEKFAVMKHICANRWDTSLPGGPTYEHEEEIALSMLRFALDNDDYELFNSGHAPHIMLLERVNQLDGTWVRPGGRFDISLMLGTLASVYHDGRYLTLQKQIPSADPFMRRYIAGVRRYSPGAEVPPVPADDLTGLRLPPTTPQRIGQIPALQSSQFQQIKFRADQALDFASFRSGFDREDDYLAVNGLVVPGAIPGTIIAFASHGMNWLGSEAATQYPLGADRYFERNGLHLLRTDRIDAAEKPYAAVAKREWSANLHRAGGLSYSLDPFVGTKWERSIVWIRPGLFVVRDEVTARQAGKFEMAVNWRPNGGPSWDGKTWTSVAQAGQFRITPLGEGFTVRQNAAAWSAGDEEALYFRQSASPALGAGQSVAATAVLQAFQPWNEAALDADRITDNAIRIHSDKAPADETLVVFGNSNGIKTDAKAVIVRPDSVQLLEGTHLEIDGKPLIKSTERMSLLIDLTAGQARIDSTARKGKQKLQIALAGGPLGTPMDIDPGEYAIPLKATGDAKSLLATALKSAASATPAPSESAGTTDTPQWPITDATGQYTQLWQYDGLQQPMPVSRVRNVGNDTVDLGQVVELAQIRPAAITRGAWFVRSLPEEIWISEGDANGNAPPVDGAGWTKITQPVEWIPGVRTGNYGETAPIEQDAQVINLDGVKARYVRAQNVGNLVFMDRNSRGSYLPMTLQLDGDTLYVLPRIWPKFVGWIQYWEDKLAALDLSGKERFSFTSTQKMLDVQLLTLPGASTKQPVVATVDGRIDVVGLDGSLEKEIPFLKLHEQYNIDFGRPNTRHPAGGFAMPFAIGMWKPDPKAEPGMVVARYHSFSFLDSSFKLDGILAEGMYVQPALLPQGIDFDGDGAEEQVTLTRGIIAQVHGPRDQRITEPTGSMFFPQVYHIKRLEEPAWDERIDGPSVILFQALQTASSAPGRPRYVAVVRDGYAGIYDGLENKWAFTWVPAAPITAATLAQDSANRVRLLVATSDSILWTFDFAGAFDKPSPSARSFAEQIVGLHGDSATPGAAFIMGQSGLYHIDPKQALERIQDGRFIDAIRLPGDQGIAATGLDGSVVGIGAKKP